MPQQLQKRARTEGNQNRSLGAKRPLTRKRTVLACEECRLRKRRCDSSVPSCGGCMKRMTECVYSSEIEMRQWNQNLIQSLRSKLQELEGATEDSTIPTTETSLSTGRISQREGALEGHELIQNPPTPELSESGGCSVTRSVDPSTQQQEPILPSPVSIVPAIPVDHLEDDSRLPASEVSSESSQSQQGATSHCIEPWSYDRLIKPIDTVTGPVASSLMKTAPLVYNKRADLTTINSMLTKTSDSFCQCDRLLDAMRCRLPLRRKADSLITIYFSRHHRMFPILHEPTFMKQYHALWESTHSNHVATPSLRSCTGLCKQKSKGRLLPATLYVIFSLAALFSSPNLAQNANEAREFFKLAETLKVFEILDEEVGIELVQLMLLMGLYLQSTERFSKCWNIAGLAIRMAQNLGLHLSIGECRRRGLLTSCPTQLEAEVRARVWYGCVLLDTDISMSFGQPLMIHSATASPKLPEAIDDHFITDESGKRNVQPKELPTVLEYYTQTIKLYGILRRALNMRETTTDDPLDAVATAQAILNLDSKVMEWHNNLPLYLRCETVDTDTNYPGDLHASFAVPVTNIILDLSALSLRLHCRFLHVRQLILRPALELIFETRRCNKQFGICQPSLTENLRDSVISNIALQCVLLAIRLVEFLAVQIRTETFLCLWYNITYLHSSGITMLLGRICNTDQQITATESISTSWKLCLQHLSSYKDLSKIAKNSLHLLQESARKYLETNDTALRRGAQSHSDKLEVHVTMTGKPSIDSSDHVPSFPLYSFTALQAENPAREQMTFHESDYLADINLSTATEDIVDQLSAPYDPELWDNMFNGFSMWNFMAPISQLSNASPQVDEPTSPWHG